MNREDMIIASVSIKYAQSNSVAFAYNGQLIGLGAGQQNRLDCIQLEIKLFYGGCEIIRNGNDLFLDTIDKDKIYGQNRLSLFMTS